MHYERVVCGPPIELENGSYIPNEMLVASSDPGDFLVSARNHRFKFVDDEIIIYGTGPLVSMEDKNKIDYSILVFGNPWDKLVKRLGWRVLMKEFYEFIDAKETLDLLFDSSNAVMDSRFIHGKYILDFNSCRIVELEKADMMTILEVYHGNNNYALVKKLEIKKK